METTRNLSNYCSPTLKETSTRNATHVFGPQFAGPLATLTWTPYLEGKNFSFCCYVRKNLLKERNEFHSFVVLYHQILQNYHWTYERYPKL